MDANSAINPATAVKIPATARMIAAIVALLGAVAALLKAGKNEQQIKELKDGHDGLIKDLERR